MPLKIDTSNTQAKHKKNTSRYEEQINKNVVLDEDCKRINMAFSDDNYEYIQSYADDYKTSIVYLINEIIRVVPAADIDTFIDENNVILGKTVSRTKGIKTKRINLKFNKAIHQKLTDGAEKYNTTISAYFNLILKIYRTS